MGAPEQRVEYGERRMTDRRAAGRINGQEVSSDIRERRNMVPSQGQRVRIRTLRQVHVTDQSCFSIPLTDASYNSSFHDLWVVLTHLESTGCAQRRKTTLFHPHRRPKRI